MLRNMGDETMDKNLKEPDIRCVYGRDGIYVDNINYNYNTRKVQIIGEINGACCSGFNGDAFIKYSLEFHISSYFSKEVTVNGRRGLIHTNFGGQKRRCCTSRYLASSPESLRHLEMVE